MCLKVLVYSLRRDRSYGVVEVYGEGGLFYSNQEVEKGSEIS